MDHLAKKTRNLALAAELTGKKFADWQVTAIFYAALHHVEQILAAKHFSDTDGGHNERDIVVKHYWQQAHSDYLTLLTLYSMSRAARYECQGASDDDVVVVARRLFQQIEGVVKM